MAPRSAQPGALLERMAAFADATRLRLLRLLEKSELGVAELVELLQLPQSTVSRHLKVLADQALVNSRAEGANRTNAPPSLAVTSTPRASGSAGVAQPSESRTNARSGDGPRPP